jgi:integrase
MSTKSGRVSTNRLLARLRHMFAWAIERDLIDSSPFVKAGQAVIKVDRKAEGARSRRLEDGEDERLLVAAGPHLRACIEATLDTGMRRGEILGLQWKHVNLRDRMIHLPATLTKTGTARAVMFSGRLAAILEMRQTGPDGQPNGAAEAYVFGDECGGRVKGFKTAWKLTSKGAGITGLTFHDLRREAGSRMLDAGNSLTDVRDFLGHRDVSQTNTYLATTAQRLRAAIEKRDLARTPLAQTTRPPVEAAVTTQ